MRTHMVYKGSIVLHVYHKHDLRVDHITLHACMHV